MPRKTTSSTSRSSSEPGFGPPTSGHLSFSSNPSLLGEVSAAASFLYGKGFRKPFLFRDTAIIYGKAACSGFQQTWEHLGGQIAGSVDFENTDPSISSQISKLKSSDADSVIMCSYPPGGAAAIKQIRAAGVELPIYGPTSFDGLYWLKGIPNTEDIYFTSNGSPYDPPNKSTEKLFAHLEEDGIDTDIGTNLLAWYAGGQLIIHSIEETHSVAGDVLATALEAKPHEHDSRQRQLQQGRSLPDQNLADIRLLRRQAELGGQGEAEVHPAVRRIALRAVRARPTNSANASR